MPPITTIITSLTPEVNLTTLFITANRCKNTTLFPGLEQNRKQSFLMDLAQYAYTRVAGPTFSRNKAEKPCVFDANN